ncbi:MAG: cupin domain-containing protein [Phaeodactylibacter sp.]|nr:cupin domain-containing protein [Phaeodactylibacter sp.]MCB9303515.1 cupin domain-containing protein [Lewinellaceae bacterium]
MHKFLNLEDMPEKEILPGFTARFIHTNTLTIGHVRITKGSVLPQHHHVQEQVTNVILGELQMTVGGETRICRPGMSVTIPSNTPHAALALTDCYVIDVFQPSREDYK